MATVTTTLKVDEALLEEAQNRYRDFGFAGVDDLIAVALADYLRHRELSEKHAAMAAAASDLQYRRVLQGVSADFADADSEHLPPEY